MFRQTLNVIPPFTRVNINENFAAIDHTLYMTATVLLHNRVDNLKLMSTICKHGISTVDLSTINTNPEIYSFHWFESSENPDEGLGTIKDKTGKITAAENIEKFIKEKFDKTVYIRILPEKNAVCLFVEYITAELWHLLQSFMSKYFEVFKTKPLTEDEINFVRSLTLKTSGNYVARMQELTETESFKKYMLNIQLDGFERKLFERKISSAEESVKGCQRSLDNLMAQIRDITKKRLDAVIYLEGLKAMTSNIEQRTELQEYLISNKSLSDIVIEESHIKFVVKTFLQPYHLDDWDNMSRRGSIFENLRGWEKADAKLLLDAIFSENHTLKLKICGHVDMDYLYCNVRSDTGYDYSRFKDYIPNTHLRRHSCFGQNSADIVTQLQSGDAIGAIECAINCVKHMNVNELSASFGPFLKDLMSSEGKCIVNENGTEMTPKEALAFLKGQNNETDTTEQ